MVSLNGGGGGASESGRKHQVGKIPAAFQTLGCSWMFIILWGRREARFGGQVMLRRKKEA